MARLTSFAYPLSTAWGKVRGINPLLATVIIIVVALALIVSVVAMLLYWYKFSLRSAPIIVVLPDSRVELNESYKTYVILHIGNNGFESVKLECVLIESKYLDFRNASIIIEQGSVLKESSKILLQPSARAYIIWVFDSDVFELAYNPKNVVNTVICLDNGVKIRTQIAVIKPR